MVKWLIGKPESSAAGELAAKGLLSLAVAEVLISRDIYDIKDAADFFGGEISDPFLLKDMKKAVDVINAAVEAGERICVYGDYDCDGICSTAILCRYLETTGADVSFHINTRAEGFGLNGDVIKRLADEGVKLIITADNGTSALSEAELAKKLGIKLVITDHHEPGGKLPKAAAVVNPHRTGDKSPFTDLCGCGVALKLIAAMDGGDYTSAIEQFSDLTALATVADVVPLRGENRLIVTYGLHYMAHSENEGLRALIRKSEIKTPLTTYKLGFIIGPRVNASGRFATATEAAELFLTEDRAEADKIADRLTELNNARKKTEADIVSECAEMINAAPEKLNCRVLCVYGSNWHHGVIGIVAARLTDRFGKPCFVMSDEDDEIVRGSARSFPGFSVFEALEYCADALTKYGGHSGAGGFSLKKENIGLFSDMLEEFARSKLELLPTGLYETPPRPVRQAVKLITPQEISLETVNALAVLEPFGEGNPEPEFLIQGAELLGLRPSAKGVHTSAVILYGSLKIPVMFFGKAPDDVGYQPGDRLDLLVSLEKNEWNGTEKVQVKIKSIRKSGINQAKFFSAENAYFCYRRGELGSDSGKIAAAAIPSREDTAAVYKLLGAKPIGIEQLYQRVSDKMNYFKFRIILDIFSEFGFTETDYFEQTIKKLSIIKKANLENSEVLAKLKTLAE
jgi:single-stranded-DNA-specific exonuclease